MKKLILLLVIFLAIPYVFAYCCPKIDEKEGGCYPERPICCETTDKNIGYIGCIANLNQVESNYCPNMYLGNCLKCSEDCRPDGTDCNWKETSCGEGLDCVIEYLPGTETPFVISQCTNKCGEGEVWDGIGEECVEIENIEDAICTNDMCWSTKFCCGSDGTFKEGQGSICSGNNDKDDICNYYDNCEDAPNTEILGTCLPLTIKKTCKIDSDCPGGACSNNQEDSDQDGIGDACEFEDLCESAYEDRQCCDLLPGVTSENTIGVGTIYGKTSDCPGPIGCYTQCVTTITDEQGNEIKITYEVSACINGQRTVKKLQNGVVIEAETLTESCSGIPLIPFFTTINLLSTFLILTLFYYFKEK